MTVKHNGRVEILSMFASSDYGTGHSGNTSRRIIFGDLCYFGFPLYSLFLPPCSSSSSCTLKSDNSNQAPLVMLEKVDFQTDEAGESFCFNPLTVFIICFLVFQYVRSFINSADFETF